MVTRVTIFLCFGLVLYSAAGVMALLLPGRTKRPRWDFPQRVVLCVLAVAAGLLGIFEARVMGSILLPHAAEQVIVLCFGGVCLLAVVILLWWRWHAPRIEYEDFKRIQKERRWRHLGLYGGLQIAILACGVSAYMWGRHAGFCALRTASVEAEHVVSELQRGGTTEALIQCQEIFTRLDGDTALAEVRAKVSSDAPTWPSGEELVRLLADRQDLLRDLEALAASSTPSLSLQPGTQPTIRWSQGVRHAGTLLDLAVLDARSRADFQSVCHLLQLRLCLADRLAHIPTQRSQLLANAIRLPHPKVFSDVLTASPKTEQPQLASYLQELRARQQALSALMAGAIMGDMSLYLLSLKHLAVDGKDDGSFQIQVLYNDFHSEMVRMATVYTRVLLPLYGADHLPRVLPESRKAEGLIRLPFTEAISAIRAARVASPPKVLRGIPGTGGIPGTVSIIVLDTRRICSYPPRSWPAWLEQSFPDSRTT